MVARKHNTNFLPSTHLHPLLPRVYARRALKRNGQARRFLPEAASQTGAAITSNCPWRNRYARLTLRHDVLSTLTSRIHSLTAAILRAHSPLPPSAAPPPSVRPRIASYRLAPRIATLPAPRLSLQFQFPSSLAVVMGRFLAPLVALATFTSLATGIKITSPKGGDKFTAGNALEVKWDEGGTGPDIADLSTYEVYLCAGPNTPDANTMVSAVALWAWGVS